MLLIDAHVHIHDCFNLGTFFNSAFLNFKSEAVKAGCGDDFTGVLLLAETARENWFSHLSRYADGDNLPGARTTGAWKFFRTKESCSISARTADGKDLILIAGRQIVTAEGLEILALINSDKFQDGQPLMKMLEVVSQSGGIAVIPWGFGKWIGRRGSILNNLLEKPNHFSLFLGDNGGRPYFWPTPSHMKLALKKGNLVLPGSDPLPFARQSNRAGGFGFILPETISDLTPGRDLIKILNNWSDNFKVFGNLERASTFFCNQIAMQMKKRNQRKKQ